MTGLAQALALKRFPLRAVAAVSDDVSDAELARMNALGVRGVRINFRNNNAATPDMAPRLVERIAPLGWHLQVHINGKDFAAAVPLLEDLAVDVVLDHIRAGTGRRRSVQLSIRRHQAIRADRPRLGQPFSPHAHVESGVPL
jgi:predicted TIM-barrel fold metal-dependent hydrolase